jgi:hypothetical protein
MNTPIIKKVERLGIKLKIEGEKLVLLGETQNLSNKQIQFLKENKQFLIMSLRLRKVTPPKYLDLILDWYKNDYQDIEGMSDDELLWLVINFLQNKHKYLNSNE